MKAQWIKVRQIRIRQERGARQVGRVGAIASTVLLSITAGCTHQPANLSASPSSEALGNAVAPQAIQQPFTSTALKPVPVPNLIPATAVTEHLPEVTTDRPDPFATLLMAPTSITRTAAPAPIAPPVIALPAPIAPTVATISVPRTLPAFQPPAGGLSIPTNATPDSVIPAVPPISAAQAIEVSGVVQAGSTTSIIIKAPDERTSRYVSVGDRLANGRVLVKRVEMGTEPVVILEQDGAEVIKAIGRG